MPEIDPTQLDLFLLEDLLWLAVSAVGLPIYDFQFETFFHCRHLWERPDGITAIGRFGVTNHYDLLYQKLLASGVRLIHSPEQYRLASELSGWYPYISNWTPKSFWFDAPPAVNEIKNIFDWPIFVRGNRQTSRHKAALSIIRSASEYEVVAEHYRYDITLREQAFICRQFVELRGVNSPSVGETIPASFEFRSFWWYGQCVGAGPYWSNTELYHWNKQEEQDGLAIAKKVANQLKLPFLVVDVAQTKEGQWIVIECNDAQECGYAGVSPVALWHNIIVAERKRISID